MKTTVTILTVALLASMGSGCQEIRQNREVLYQASSISTLMGGVYEGDVSIAQLQRHGDIGLGTFNAFDGEMVVSDGAFYRITADGIAYPIVEEDASTTLTPFAAVTFFDPDQSVAIHGLVNYGQLKEHIDNFINTNAIYAIKIDGFFRHIKVRSVSRLSRPYPSPAAIAAGQQVHEFSNVQGTIVGFRVPEHLAGVNVIGYHLHFINADRTRGGHLLDCQMEDVNVMLDYTSELHMILPDNDLFSAAPITLPAQADLNAIESR